MQALRCRVIPKRLGTVEVRTFVQLANQQWHLLGTWNVPALHWQWLRPMLVSGASAGSVPLTFDA